MELLRMVPLIVHTMPSGSKVPKYGASYGFCFGNRSQNLGYILYTSYLLTWTLRDSVIQRPRQNWAPILGIPSIAFFFGLPITT